MSIDVKEIHPHAGSVWQRACGLWGEYVQHDTWTWDNTWGSQTFSGQAFLQLLITIIQTDDTYNYFLVLNDTPLADSYGRNTPNYIVATPGFTSLPPVRANSYGARNTMTSWHDSLHPIHIGLIRYGSGAPYEDHEYSTGGGYIDPQNERNFGTMFFTYQGSFFFADVVQIWAAGAEWNPAGGQPTMNPYEQNNSPSAGSGIDASAIKTIVAALNEIAMIDTTYSANNGATTFSMRGKVRTGS